jgi:hypothetical protein
MSTKHQRCCVSQAHAGSVLQPQAGHSVRCTRSASRPTASAGMAPLRACRGNAGFSLQSGATTSVPRPFRMVSLWPGAGALPNPYTTCHHHRGSNNVDSAVLAVTDRQLACGPAQKVPTSLVQLLYSLLANTPGFNAFCLLRCSKCHAQCLSESAAVCNSYQSAAGQSTPGRVVTLTTNHPPSLAGPVACTKTNSLYSVCNERI